jgi:hypothetical protein
MAARQPMEKDGGRKNCQNAKYGPRRNCLNRVLLKMFGGFRRPGCLVRKRDPWALRPRLAAGVP